MVHYRKHIIDRETGLCEICDRGAIYMRRKGRRFGKQYLYTNQDGRFTYRPTHGEVHKSNEQTTPRSTRKSFHSEPPPAPPPAKTRPVVYEEPVVVPKRILRQEYAPVDDVQPPSRAHPATLYYVDNPGQMPYRNEGPKDERRYTTQNPHTSPVRPARVVQQRAETPPVNNVQPASRTHPATLYYVDNPGQMSHRNEGPKDEHRYTTQNPHTSPVRPARVIQQHAETPPPPTTRRQPNRDTEVVDRPYVVQPFDSYQSESPKKANMYYLDQPQRANRYTTISSLAHRSQDGNTPLPPSKVTYQEDLPQKQRHLEPMESKQHVQPEITVVRRVYKKLPKNKYDPSEDEHVFDGDHVQPVRKVEKFYPSPRQYESSLQSTNKHIRSPIPTKNPSIYYIQSTNA